MYCIDCGKELPTGASFCPHCGSRGPSAKDDRQAKGSTAVPRWVGYAAFGLFVIGLVSFLLPWLIFCFWCHRRGRWEGAALTGDVESPLPYFPARLGGWFLASVLLPIVAWFTAVHVPTMCYQQGLRVGASKGTASKSFTDVHELAFAAMSATSLVWIGMASVAFYIAAAGGNDRPASVGEPASVGGATLQEQIAGWEWDALVVGCRKGARWSPRLVGQSWEESLEIYIKRLEASDAYGIGLEPGFPWDFCLHGVGHREKAQQLRLTTTVTAPDGRTWESVGLLRLGDSSIEQTCTVYPIDFPGASSGTPGVYTAVFEVEGMNVGHTSCTVVEP